MYKNYKVGTSVNLNRSQKRQKATETATETATEITLLLFAGYGVIEFILHCHGL